MNIEFCGAAKHYPGWQQPEPGEIVDVAPHLFGTYVLHRNWQGQWRVSQVETGCGVPGSDAKTKRESVELARKRLAKITPQKLAAAIRKLPAWVRET